MHDESRPKAAPETAPRRASEPQSTAEFIAGCHCWEATAWRLLCSSPHVLDLIGEYTEWTQRKVTSETSAQLSAAGRWTLGVTYEELRERRRLTSVHPCGRCGTQVELCHPLEPWQFEALPDLSWVRCPAHAEAA